MCAHKESEKKIRRIKIVDEILLALGRGKIIFKETSDARHITLSFLKEGILDIHETIEGREKKHIPLEKLELRKFAGYKETLIKEILHNLKEIDITDPKYVDGQVFVIQEKKAMQERVQKIMKTKRREIVFEENKLMDVMKDLFIPIKDLQDYDFKTGFLLKEDEEHGLLFRVESKYLFISFNDLEALIKKTFERFKA